MRIYEREKKGVSVGASVCNYVACGIHYTYGIHVYKGAFDRQPYVLHKVFYRSVLFENI